MQSSGPQVQYRPPTLVCPAIATNWEAEFGQSLVKNAGSVRMQKTANNVLSLFLTEFTSFNLRNINHTELYRRLGKRVITLADHALELRQTDNAYVLSEMLNNMPGNFRHIGRYYQAMCLKRKGQVVQARNLLEYVAQNQDTPLSYRARALHAIGATYYEADTPIEALRYYLEAARAGSFAKDIFSTTQ